MGRPLALAAHAGAVLASLPSAAAAQAPGDPVGAAPDGPGALSHFDLARKDCVGTARNTTSKVWFTVAHGVLSDVYFPTIDNTIRRCAIGRSVMEPISSQSIGSSPLMPSIGYSHAGTSRTTRPPTTTTSCRIMQPTVHWPQRHSPRASARRAWSATTAG